MATANESALRPRFSVSAATSQRPKFFHTRSLPLIGLGPRFRNPAPTAYPPWPPEPPATPRQRREALRAPRRRRATVLRPEEAVAPDLRAAAPHARPRAPASCGA